MKRLLSVGAASVALFIAANPAQATNYVLALASTSSDGAKPALTQLTQELYRKLAPGDVVIVYDATHQREVARGEVPANPLIAANRNLKAKAINGWYGPIWDFLDAADSGTGDAGDVAPPRLLHDLAGILDAVPGHTAQVIVAGSALYSDRREPTFSMRGGYVPADAHLLLNQDKSPFGTAGREKALQGATVHFCYTDGSDAWTTDIFRQHVGRLWALETKLQGGRFGSFGPLDAGCIANFLDNVVSTETFTLDRSDTKATMQKFERVTMRPVEPATANPASGAPPATAEDMFRQTPCTAAPTTFIGPMRIGIKWDCPNCDLDLYARSRPESEWLYYGHRLPADGNGFFDHDWTTPPPGGDGYEYVQFNSVDLRQVSARVNLFAGGMTGGQPFRLRIWFAGCVFDAPPLRIAASSGNSGNPVPDGNWTDVDVLAVTGLRSAVPPANASSH